MYFVSVDVAYMKPDRQAIYNNIFWQAPISYVCVYICIHD